MEGSIHTNWSSYREAVLEHLFVGELLRTLWRRSVHAEILRPLVDDAGYDLVVAANGGTRHIQLKSSFLDAKTARQSVNVELGRKPSGCVVWLRFDETTLRFDEYLWFGNRPGQPLPSLEGFAVSPPFQGKCRRPQGGTPQRAGSPEGRIHRHVHDGPPRRGAVRPAGAGERIGVFVCGNARHLAGVSPRTSPLGSDTCARTCRRAP